MPFQGGNCGFFCSILGQLHCVSDAPPDCPVFPLHVFVLDEPSIGGLILDAKPVKVFAQ